MPRVTIVPGKYENERIEELVRCCKKYRYDEVIFFINNESLFRGFLTKDEIVPNLELIKRAKKRLDEIGVKTSLNPWATVVHCERGRKMRPDLTFARMVDINGDVGELIVCPSDEKWRDYFCDFFAFIAAEVRPETIWIEDDMRLLNHAPLKWGGCFCEKHMKMYSEYIGRDVTRKELVDGMASGAENGIYRKAYFYVNRREMNELAGMLEKAVHARAPQTKIGLMTGDPSLHSIEGRDWFGITKGYSGSEDPVVRIHMPMYRQVESQRFCWFFNTVSLATRALLPSGSVVLPEVENAKFSLYTKSRNMTRFQTETTLALCADGVTLDIDCFCGGGVIDAYGYGDKLNSVKDFLGACKSLDIPFSSMSGITVPISEDGFLRASCVGSVEELRNDEFYWAGHFASVGIAFKYEKKQNFENKIVALSGNMLLSYTDDEIEKLFDKNCLILDGVSVKILFARGLQRLINAVSYEQYDAETDERFSIEEAAEGRVYMGINGARASTCVTCPPCLKIEYGKEPTVYTNILDSRENFVCCNIVRFDNCLIFPYLGTGRFHGALTDLRTEALKSALTEIKKYDSDVVFCNEPYLAAYYYKTEKSDYVMLINFSDDDYDDVTVYGLPPYRFAKTLSRETGEKKDARFTENGGFVGKIPATSVCVFEFVK